MFNSVVLLLMFALSSAPVEATDVSVLAGKLTNCMIELCTDEILICHRLYGKQLMENFKDCMKQLCTEQMSQCVDWIIAQKVAATSLEVIKDSFIHCYLHCGFQNKTKFTGCFLDALVDKTQPYISMLAAASSDPDFLRCCLRRGLGAVKSCFHHYSELSYTVIRNIVSETVNNNQEYVTCFVKVYNNGDQKCLQMFMQLFGSTPATQERDKDFFICFVNEMISLTAAC